MSWEFCVSTIAPRLSVAFLKRPAQRHHGSPVTWQRGEVVCVDARCENRSLCVKACVCVRVLTYKHVCVKAPERKSMRKKIRA